MTRFLLALGARLSAAAALAIVLGLTLGFTNVSAAPSADVAKRCVHYSYVAYPFKRPGAVHMSGDRQAYCRDCIAKNGDVPSPTPPKA